MKHLHFIVLYYVLFASIRPVRILLSTKNYNVSALILARSGSKGIPNKNLAKIGNETLLKRSLNVLHKFGRFNSVWVSTDSLEIAEEAIKTGSFVYRRSKKFASDTSSSIDAVKEFLHSHHEIDIIALIQCTSPFLYPGALEIAYRMITMSNFDSVFSATRSYKLRWKNRNDGSVYPLNFDPENRPRRQSWTGELVETGMFYFTNTYSISKNSFQTGRVGIVEIPSNRSIEIDTEDDLHISRILAPHLDKELLTSY